MNFTQFLLQDAPAAADKAAGNPGFLEQYGSIFFFVAIIAIFYLFIIRPQNKKQKETEKMIKALKKGDKVITIGGINGVVSSTKETTVIVKVDDGAKIEFNRSAIAAVVAPSAEEAPKTEVNK